jgi:uncharacterized protein YkwD
VRQTIPTVALALLGLLLVAAPVSAAPPLEQLLAPVEACPNQAEAGQSAPAKERAMRCLTNFARRQVGLRGLAYTPDLGSAADRKAGDILACDEFSHEACGREFDYWMRRSGYVGDGCWRAGENIAWGSGRLGSVRPIFDAWLHSPGHRENILGAYSQVGIGLRTGSIDGYPGAAVWVQQFGSHC